jgi:carboxylesterase
LTVSQEFVRLLNQPFLLETLSNKDQVCLLLHGLGGGVYEMQLLGEYLHVQGLSVRGINYPGHDRPITRMPSSTWQQWYDYILETYKQLSQKYSSIFVIGFSTGCPLALHLAASYPVSKLVLLSPFLAIRYEPYYLLRLEAYLLAIGQLVKYLHLPRLRLPIQDKVMRQAAEAAAFFQTFNLSSVRSAIELIDRVKLELPEIEVPTLVIQSPKDTVVDPAGAEFIYRQLGSKIKKLHWLKNSDHIISLDVEREEVFAQIGEFLSLNLEVV